jgi:hypothetical protein
VFLHPVGSVRYVLHFGVSALQNVDTLFFILGWDQYRLDKKHVGTHYAELVFLRPVGCAGQVVHSSASRARNVDALFFMIGCNRYRYDKKRVGNITPNLCFCI